MFKAFSRFNSIILTSIVFVSCSNDKESSVRVTYPDVKLTLSHLLSPPVSGELAGQTWQAGPTVLSFQRGNHVLLRGGHLTESMPTGAPGTYSLESQTLTLSVLGRTYTGTWDGTKLTINDKIATYLGPTETIFPDTVLHYPPQPEKEPHDANENP